ncbi:MAG: PQQ-binding-like beta-propeller repeat protein [Candidatus Sericytochromatia bacterium]|nr:PQQ-binding-like beta-propeller repeat protein [Candidatus Sericytochromatia bacterium]
MKKLWAVVLAATLLQACAAQPERRFNLDWNGIQGGFERTGALPDAPRPPLKQKWVFETEGRLVYPPAVFQGQVYLGSRDSQMYALRLEDGSQVWRTDLPQGGIFSAPVIWGDAIYAGTWVPYYSVMAWDLSSGTERWATQTGEMVNRPPWVLTDALQLYTHRDPAIGDDEAIKVVAAAWDYDTREPRWEQPLMGIPAVAPALAPEAIIYATDDQRLTVLERATGKIRWQAELESVPVSAPLVHGERVMVATETGFVYAFELATGATAWRFQFKGARLSGDLALSGQRLLVPGGQFLYTFDIQTLEEGWRFRGPPTVLTPAIASPDFVYIGAANKLFYVLDARQGTVAGMYRLGGEILAAPVAAEGLVLVAASDGKLYAFEEQVLQPNPAQQPQRPSRW